MNLRGKYLTYLRLFSPSERVCAMTVIHEARVHRSQLMSSWLMSLLCGILQWWAKSNRINNSIQILH